MNFLIIGYSDPSGYSYLIKMANKLTEKGNKIIFAIDNPYYPKASYVNLEKYSVRYFDKWEKNYIDSKYQNITLEYSNEAAYINFERLKCINAKKIFKKLFQTYHR